MITCEKRGGGTLKRQNSGETNNAFLSGTKPRDAFFVPLVGTCRRGEESLLGLGRVDMHSRRSQRDRRIHVPIPFIAINRYNGFKSLLRYRFGYIMNKPSGRGAR